MSDVSLEGRDLRNLRLSENDGIFDKDWWWEWWERKG